MLYLFQLRQFDAFKHKKIKKKFGIIFKTSTFVAQKIIGCHVR